jgi:hypothetical protein
MRRPSSGNSARSARWTSGWRALCAGTAVAVATIVELAVVRIRRTYGPPPFRTRLAITDPRARRRS